MTITHGVLRPFGTYDNLVHEIKEIVENDYPRVSKKINWKKTKVFDNSNPARYQNLSNHREKWR